MLGLYVFKLNDDLDSLLFYNFRDLINIDYRLPLNMEPEPFVDAICAAWDRGEIDIVNGNDGYDYNYEDNYEDENDICCCDTGRFCSRCGE